MTYGVYDEDLSAYSLHDVDLDTARRFMREGKVICSLKEKKCGIALSILWEWRWKMSFRRYGIWLGPFYITWSWKRNLVADKIVERYQRNGDKE